MFTLFCVVLMTAYAYATHLVIENVRPVYRTGVAAGPPSIIFDIRWDNAWRNLKNHDAVWVFMKFNGYYDNHVKLLPQGYRILQNRVTGAPPPTLTFSPDSLGFFISAGAEYRGPLNYKLEILMYPDQPINNQRVNQNFRVHGIEMVYIPEGPFTLGSPDTAAVRKAAFYRSDAEGKPAGLVSITSEAAIPVGPAEGQLYYWSEEPLYNGDQQGPIPAAFPKGFQDFYVMKYELSQGQYADFLNSLPDNWTYLRSPVGGRTYQEGRGGIRLENGQYHAGSYHRPMNYISFTDGLAYADWAALRPITELEYEKAARGPGEPQPGEFVWGTNTYDRLERYVRPDTELYYANGWDESRLSDATRPVFGASYYWVMDLSGSVWEKVITVGNPIGRQFTGTHGDGRLRFGQATNADWPNSNDEVGGFGYRGGGYYQIGTYYSDFNPHSPIGYRYYGSWSGGPHSIAYGFRAGRTAP